MNDHDALSFGLTSAIGALGASETFAARVRKRGASAEAGTRSDTYLRALPALTVSAVGLLLLLFATPFGLGVSADSTQYLSVVDHLLRGEGLRVHWWDPGSQPLTHFPPGFAVVLSAFTALGLTPDTSARLINAAALFATVFLIMALARRSTDGSTTAGVLAALAVVLARDFMTAHVMIWSEPMFLAMTLGALLATIRALESDEVWPLVLAASLAGLAALTRYVAPAVIGACALSLLLLGSGTWGRRFLRAVAFGAAASIPLAVLLAFNASQGAATNRELVLHPPGQVELMTAVKTGYYWIVPLQAEAWLRAAVAVVVGLAAAWFLFSLVRTRGAGMHASQPAMRARLVLVTYCACYAALLLVTLALLDAQSTPGPRLLVPLVPPVAILVVSMLADSMRVSQRRTATLAFGGTMLAGLVVSVSLWVVQARREGIGYSAPVWRTSVLIAAVRKLGPETTVFTNEPGAILFQTGREVLGVPRLANPNSRLPNADFASQMSAVCTLAANGPVAYVHFTGVDAEWFLPTLTEVRRRWRSTARLEAPEGVLDVVPPNCAAH